MAKRLVRIGFVVSVLVGFLSGWAAEMNVRAQSLQQLVAGDDAIATTGGPAPRGDMSELISLEFRATEAADVLRYLAQKAGLNLSISTKVTGRVSLMVNEVPIRDVFNLVLRSNSLAYDKQGEVIHVMAEEEYKALYGKNFSDFRQVRTFHLKYAIPEQAFNLLDTLKSSIGRLLIDENTGTVMMIDTVEHLDQMEEALAVLEQKAVVRIFDLKYANALDVEEKLLDDFEAGHLGLVQADERTNQLIVRTLVDRMDEVEGLILALDRKTREVLIDAKIVKITLTDDLDTGINWSGIFTNLDFHGIDKTGDFRATTDSTTPGAEVPSVTPIQLAPKFGLDPSGSLGGKEFGRLIFTTISRDGYELFRYLKQFGETKLISKPRLLITENEEAKIHVGTREAYVTTTTTTGTSTSTTAEEVEFIDVGIQFSVTPRITVDGFIEMTIEPQVSSVVRTLTTNSGNKIPIVDTSTAHTKVLVKDGATVIIAGLRKQENKTDNEAVPIFSKIPLFGPMLFQQKDHDDELQELIIFITPHIVHGDTLVTGDEEKYGGGFKPYRDYVSTDAKTPQMTGGDGVVFP